MAAEILARAFNSTRGVLGNVDRSQLGAPTPCASWRVSDVINHVVTGSFFCGLTAREGSPTPPQAEDFAGGDYVARYGDGTEFSIGVFETPGILEKPVKLPFGEFPCAVFMSIAATDHFVHGWDLAKATGQSTDLSPEVATELLETVRPAVTLDFRGADGVAPFGPEQEAGRDASAADRLAAFLGRRLD